MFDLIAFDADDTLWHSEYLYQQAEEELKRLLADRADGETVTRRLFETEMVNLEYYGYGIKSFTLSMIETALNLARGRISGTEVQQILAIGKGMLEAEVRLFDHAEETIHALAGSYELMLITRGDLRDQEWKLAQSGLGDCFRHVEIVSRKTRDTYTTLLARHGIQPQCFLMVGNSLRSDILPVVAVGGQAVHIPHAITWAHEEVDHLPVDLDGYYELEHLGQLPPLIERLIRERDCSHSE